MEEDQDGYVRVKTGCLVPADLIICPPRIKAIIFMNLNSLSVIIYQSMAKVSMKSGVNVIDLCLMRTFVNFMIAIFTMIIAQKRPLGDLPQDCRFLLFVRSVAGLIGFTTLVIGVFYIPISIAAIIFGTTPFWTAILGYLINNTEVQKIDIFCMVGCFMGVIFLTMCKGEDADKQVEYDQDKYALGVACIVITSWTWSLANVLTRKLKDVHVSLMMFHYGWLASSILLIYLVWEHMNLQDPFNQTMRFLSYNFQQYTLLFGLSLVNAFGLNLLTLAFQYEKQSAFLTLIHQMEVVYAFIVDVMLFAITFTNGEIIGATIILSFNLYALYHKTGSNIKCNIITKTTKKEIKEERIKETS